MKIAIATIFYNNCLELQRLMDSIPNKVVDYFIGVDGPFRYNLDMNPDLPHKSNDGSLEVINNSAPKFNSSVIIHYKTGATEFDKRNTYLEDCEKLGDVDVIIITDSDEYFTYDMGNDPLECWNRFKKNIELEMYKNPHHNVYGIRYLQDGVVDTYKPRIWVKPHKMRYINGSHYHYANIIDEAKTLEQFKNNRINYVQQAASIIKGGVIMTQDQSLRSEEHIERRKAYQQYLIRYEELIQSYKFTDKEADKMAKDDPAVNFNP